MTLVGMSRSSDESVSKSSTSSGRRTLSLA
jgi:hypothetical protein